MNKKITLISTLGICSLLVYGIISIESSNEDKEEDQHHHHDFVTINASQLQTHQIETQQAKQGNLQHIIRAPTQLVVNPNQVAHVLPKVSGIAATTKKNLGEQVTADEILATIESKEMAEAKLSYINALKKLQLTTNTYEREKELHEKMISSTQDYNEAKNQWESAEIELELSRQNLLTLGLNAKAIEELPSSPIDQLRIYQLRAPIAGQIIEKHITLGELINENQEVYLVANLSNVWAEISIFAQDRSLVKPGQNLKIMTNDGRETRATVLYLSPIINENTRTSTAIAEIDNRSGNWLPGTFAQAEITVNESPVGVIVPREAVQNIEGSYSIFIAAADGFSVRSVSLGKNDEKHYEVIEGLAPGETYAYKNTFLLKAELLKDEAEHMD